MTTAGGLLGLGCLSEGTLKKGEHLDNEGNNLEEVLTQAEDEAKSALDRALELEQRLADTQQELADKNEGLREELIRQVQLELQKQQTEREQQIVDSFTKILEQAEAREDTLIQRVQELTRQVECEHQADRESQVGRQMSCPFLFMHPVHNLSVCVMMCVPIPSCPVPPSTGAASTRRDAPRPVPGQVVRAVPGQLCAVR